MKEIFSSWFRGDIDVQELWDLGGYILGYAGVVLLGFLVVRTLVTYSIDHWREEWEATPYRDTRPSVLQQR